MRTILSIVLAMAFSPALVADEVSDVLSTLGVPRAQFDALWVNACPPDVALSVPAAVLDNERSIVGPGVKYGFFQSETAGGNKLLITSGPVCAALRGYYFGGARADSDIARFVERDQAFKARYGYSVIDAWGLEKYGSASMNGKVDEFMLAHWRALEKKGLIAISSEDSRFNGSPSTAYFSALAEKGEALKAALDRAGR